MKNRRLRSILFSGLFAFTCCVSGFIGYAYYSTHKRLTRSYPTQIESISIPNDPASIAHGRHLVESIGHCTGCHGPNLGGNLEKEIPGFAIIRGPNITQGSGSVTRNYRPEDWARAIQRGIRPDGTPLIFMPAMNYRHFSRSDIAAMIAAIQTFPPVDQKMEPASIGPIGRIVLILNREASTSMIPAEHIDHANSSPTSDSNSTITQIHNLEYGKYITQVGGCTHCHGANLTGGRIPGTPPSIPPATNLTSSGPLKEYSAQDFIHLLRTGRRPNGAELNDIMPWRGTAKMTDEELTSLYNYLKTL
jgi:mono/diheme cytochrome c family protein